MKADRGNNGEMFASANGLEICWQSFGRDDAQPMLLIMGLGAQMTAWDDEFCESLAERGYRVIRFDNRDVGRSSKLGADAPPYLLADMAADAVGLLDFLKLESAHIIGASMGGMIAQEMAIRRPERVRTLTSIMSTTGDPGLPSATPEAMALLIAPPPETPAAFLEAFPRHMSVLRGPGFPRDEARDRARAERAVARGFYPEGVARQFRAVATAGGRAERLKHLKMPALIIHGTDDPLVPLTAGEAAAEAIPNARLVVIEHMGHSLPIEIWLHVIDAIDQTAKRA